MMLRLLPVRKKLLYLSFTLLFISNAAAQKEKNNWYFGRQMGLDFNSGSPVFVPNSSIDTWAGCSTVSDSSGKLLFYTDGVTVFDRTHAEMPNGTYLKNSSSASQSCIIVKKPGSDSLYYIFTTDYGFTPSGGLHYSIVDMSENGGLGDVIEKNTELLSGRFAEKVTAVKNAWGCGYWIIFCELNSDRFYSFSLTHAGVDPVPVVSTALSIEKRGTGYLKASPDGKKLAGCFSEGTELYDFNAENGEISNGISLGVYGSYGCSFSPNSRFLYTGNWAAYFRLFQFDVSLPTAADILASKTIIFDKVTYAEVHAAFQLGPDGKIYIVQQINHDLIAPIDEDRLGIIHNPNVKGAACNYVDSGFMIGSIMPAFCTWGLPNFIDAEIPFVGKDTCPDMRCEITFPNIFTPNNDGINDIFRDNNNCTKYKFTMYVYNRWGEKMYEGNNTSAGWDGKYKGEPVPAGVYYVTVNYADAKRKPYSGTLTLLR